MVDHKGPKMIKIVLVGDTSVGKSCLIKNYLENVFTDNYEPTVLDIFRGTKNVKKKQIELEIHDTSGDDHLGANRKIQFQEADIFMVCVAVNSRDSLDSIPKWQAEIAEVMPDRPQMLVLTKSDLLEYTDDPVTYEEIKTAKEERGMQGCCQTSSKVWEDHNVHKAFVRTIATGYF